MQWAHVIKCVRMCAEEINICTGFPLKLMELQTAVSGKGNVAEPRSYFLTRFPYLSEQELGLSGRVKNSGRPALAGGS